VSIPAPTTHRWNRQETTSWISWLPRADAQLALVSEMLDNLAQVKDAPLTFGVGAS